MWKRRSKELYDVKLEKDCAKIMIDTFGTFCVIAFNKKIRSDELGEIDTIVSAVSDVSEETDYDDNVSIYDTVTKAFRKVRVVLFRS